MTKKASIKNNLPIFDAEETIHRYESDFIDAAANSGNASMIRRINLAGPVDKDFIDYISETEESFTEMHERLGMIVVPHLFGLYPITDRPELKYLRDRKRGVPDGFILAARVALVRSPALTMKEKREKFRRKIKVYQGISRYRNANGIMIDTKDTQFIYGELPLEDVVQEQMSANGLTYLEKQWVMVDIEPRHRRKIDPHDRIYTRP